MVRAWATEHGLALGTVNTDVKSNESTAIPELLKGAIVTIGAMGCQTGIAEQIVAQGGAHVHAVKENQLQLYATIVDFMAAAERHGFAGVAHTFHESYDIGHGKVEERR